MRVTIVSQFYAPEPVYLQSDIAKELSNQGHEVTVVTGFPNYPGGRVMPGYRVRTRQIDEVDGIRVIRLPLFPSHDDSAAHRAFNYLSFALSVLTLGAPQLRRSDVVYVYHPPGTTSFAAALLCRVLRRPCVVHIQDIWPDSVLHAGFVGTGVAVRLMSRVLSWTSRMTYLWASRIIVISPGFKALLTDRGADPHKIDVVFNWANEPHQSPPATGQSSITPEDPPTRFVVLYAGNMGPFQGLAAAIEAAAMVSDLPGFELLLIGDGLDRQRLVDLAERQQIANVEFRARVAPEEIGPILEGADVHLVSLVDLPFFSATIPGKTQAALCAGRPLIVAVRGDAADLVERAGSGLTCEPGSAASLAKAFRTAFELRGSVLQNMGASGRRYYEENLAFAHAGLAITKVIESLEGSDR